MERETPPPLPTAAVVRDEQLTPSSALPDVNLPHYLELSANSGRWHNNALRALSLNMQCAASFIALRLWNDLRIYHHDRWLAALAPNRPSNQSLLSVSNHASTIDDPTLLAALTPRAVMTDVHAARWGWCAREMCFKHPILSWCTLHGKIVPIVRGLGLHQRGMREAAEHLARGEHFHVFPEGKCIPVPSGIAPLRWGVGKLVADAYRRSMHCQNAKAEMAQFTTAAANSTSTAAPLATPASGDASSAALSSDPLSSAAPFTSPAACPSPCPLPPLVVPFVHHGMTRVMPFYHVIPKSGHLVRLIVGEKIDFTDLVELHDKNQHNR